MDRSVTYHRRWWILGTLCLCLLLVGLDNLILNIALPTIQQSMDATQSDLQWMVDAYAVVFGALLLFSGGLGDRFGRKRVLFVGLAAFGVSSLVAAYAPSVDALIAARASMGVAAALIMPSTLSIIKDVFPPEEQSRAIGVWGGVAALGIPLGPVVGGLLLDHFWWGSVFLVNVPLVLLALLAGARLIPESRARGERRLDVGGAVLSAATLGTLIYGLIEAPRNGWTDPATVGWFSAALILGGLFLWWESRASSPMLPLSLVRRRTVAAPTLTIVMMSFGLFGSMFLLTQYLQVLLGLTPLQAGLRLLPVSVIIVAAPLSTWLSDRLGMRPVVTVGLAIATAGMMGFSTLGADDGLRVLIPMFLMGFGGGLALPPCSVSILGATPYDKAGAGSALSDTAQQVGGALGIAVLGSAFSSAYTGAIGSPAGLPAEALVVVRDSLSGALAVAEAAGGRAGRLLEAVAGAAFLDALGTAMLVAAGVVAAAAVASAFLLPRRALKGERPVTATAPETPAAPGAPIPAPLPAHEAAAHPPAGRRD